MQRIYCPLCKYLMSTFYGIIYGCDGCQEVECYPKAKDSERWRYQDKIMSEDEMTRLIKLKAFL